MTALRRVPWYSSLEWLEVYNGIFSENNEAKRAAVRRISLWELKSLKVPVAVSCTKLFLETFLADLDASRYPGELQMMYGMAIVRFVNSHVDLQQQKHYAESIAVAATAMGIPCEVVNCRHRLTHNDMPSLELLRHTAKLCWEYLAVRYWRPQAAIIQARVDSIATSKHLASGLIALLRDLETMAPPEDLEQSLEQLIRELALKHVTVRTLLLAAASVAGLRQRDTMRALRRLKVPEVLGQPAFVAVTTWCSAFRELLPRCLSFIETVLHTCPQEDLLLSFLKDLVLVALDPEVNYAAAVCVFWILAREPSNFTVKLVSRIVRSLAPLGQSDVDDTDQNNLSNNGSAETSSAQSSSIVDNSASPLSDTTCFNAESFSLWLRAMDVDPTHEEQLKEDLETLGCRQRLLSWLRCLLLLPPANADSTTTFVPLAVDLALHLFCNLRPDAGGSFHATSWFSTRDTFARQMLGHFNLVQTRTLSACRWLLRPVAITAFECFFAKTRSLSADASDALQHLLCIFNEADVKVPHTNTARLVEWFNQRLPVTGCSRSTRRSVLDRFFPDARCKADTATSLGDQLHAILWSLRYRAANPGCEDNNVSTQIAHLHCDTLPNNDVQQLCTISTPWTTPGSTVNPLTHEIAEPYAERSSTAVQDVLMTLSPNGQRYGDATVGNAAVAGREKRAAPPQAPERIGGHGSDEGEVRGVVVKRARHDREWRTTPAAIRQLEDEILARQQHANDYDPPQTETLEQMARIATQLQSRLNCSKFC